MTWLELNLPFWVPTILSIITLAWNLFQQKILEKIKRDNQKEITRHNTQFEKEFQVLIDIWEPIIEFKFINAQFISEYKFKISDPKWIASDEFRNEIKKIGKYHSDLMILFYKRKPFIPPSIYSKAKHLFDQLNEDFTTLCLLNKDFSNKIESALKTNEIDRESFLNLLTSQVKILSSTEDKIDEVSNAIRQRLFGTV